MGVVKYQKTIGVKWLNKVKYNLDERRGLCWATSRLWIEGQEEKIYKLNKVF